MFKFKGISSKDMQVVIEEEEHFIARAARRYETIEIEGRDGAIFEELGYSYVERPIYVQCLNVNKIDNILAWLDGEGEFEYKGRKTTARFYSELEPQREGYIRIIDTTFIRDPFWTKLDDEYIEVKGRKDITTPKSSNINVKDSSDLNAKVDVYGISEQDGEPSPSNIVDIENVTGNIDITVWNKNFLKMENLNCASAGLNWQITEDEAKITGTATSGYSTSNEIECLITSGSYKFLANGASNLIYRIWLYNSKNEMIKYATSGEQFTLTEDVVKYRLVFDNLTTGNTYNTTFKPMIVLAETNEDFVKHQEQLITFPFQEGQRLMDCDYPADDGIHHKRTQVELDGTEAWFMGVDLTNTIAFGFVKDGKKSGVGLCNMFKTKSSGISSIDEEFCQFENANNIIYIRINKNKLNTNDVAGFKSWLAQQKQAGTPVIVEYELATEEIEAYTPEQQEAYNKLQNVLSYKTETNVFTNQGLLEFKYIEDTTEKITNEGSVYSRPILRLEKTICNEVDIMIEDVRFQYDFNDEEYVEIDCEEKEATYEGLNRDRQLKIGYEFPKLKAGENEIKMYEGDCIIKAKRKDRWL